MGISYMLALEHLFQPFGLDLVQLASTLKLVRHLDGRFDVAKMYRQDVNQFESYQQYQSSKVFANTAIVLSFLGEGERRAIFVGAYSVGAVSAPGSVNASTTLPIDTSDHYHYELTRIPGFELLAGRVVIDWGSAARAWHQWFRPRSKRVIEVLPEGYIKDFPGYLNVVLTFDELVAMVAHPEANREWHQMLASVAGVYLVLDVRTGKQYVGSAYGESGLLGRWRSYARTGHAGNRQLKALAAEDRSSVHHLQFSILQTLDRALTRQEVHRLESLHKKKLGSRAHGLNDN